jgi:hypothetical protein
LHACLVFNVSQSHPLECGFHSHWCSDVSLHVPFQWAHDDLKTSLVGVFMSQAVNTPSRNNLIVDTYIKQGQNRKAIAFCCDIAHAEDLAEAFRWVACCLTMHRNDTVRAR